MVKIKTLEVGKTEQEKGEKGYRTSLRESIETDGQQKRNRLDVAGG